MHRHWPRLLLIACIPALGGCVAGIAAGALGAVVRGSQGEGGQPSGTAAAQACSGYAAQYGAVHIIDVEQRGSSSTVWGTVGDGPERRSFQCDYRTRITDFKLRAITPRS